MPALLRLCSLLALVASAVSGDTCFSAINQLATYDKALGEAPDHPSQSRLNQKQTFARSEATTEGFVTKMKGQQSQGTGFSCGYTADWVMEMFQGLSPQYVAKRLGNYGNETEPNVKAGYHPVAGQAVIDFFTQYREFGDRVVFKLVHSTPIDHVFVVEQLPAGAGYRVYQSYNSVYGLNAWLAPSTANLSEMFDHGDIMANPKLEPMFNSTVQALFGPNVTLENLDDVPDSSSPLVPLLKAYIHSFLGNNTKEAVLANFQRSKALYGEGSVLSKADFFGNYLPKLANMSSFLKENWGLSTPIPQSVGDAWLEMYGTSNLLIFPGAPFNLLPAVIQPSATQYYLQAFAVVVPDDSQCNSSRNVLASSLLKPARREAADAEDILGAPQPSLSRWNGALFGSIAVVAALSMGLIFSATRQLIHHRSSKPVVYDLELPALVVSGLPSVPAFETPGRVPESF